MLSIRSLWTNRRVEPDPWLEIPFIMEHRTNESIQSLLNTYPSIDSAMKRNWLEKGGIALKTQMEQFIITLSGNVRKVKVMSIEQHLSEYETIRPLGQGTYGAVEVIRRRSNQQLYIRKYAHSFESVPALKDEGHYILQVQEQNDGLCHPNVTCMVDFTHDPVEQRHFMVLKYFPSTETLDSVCRRLDTYTYFDKVVLSYQLIAGVLLLHQAGIAHCDLTTNNIIVYEKTNLYIIDFGIACSERRQDCFKLLTKRIFTSRKMQGENEVHYDIARKSDWYSIGLLIYLIWHDGYLPYVNLQGIIPDDIPDPILSHFCFTCMDQDDDSRLSESFATQASDHLLQWLRQHGYRRSLRLQQKKINI